MGINPKDIDSIKEKIEEIVNKLKASGLLPKDTDAKKLAETVTEKFKNSSINLSLDDVKNNPETQKKLGVACMAQNKFGNKFDCTETFNLILDPDLNNKLKNILKLALELKPNNKTNRSDEEKQKLDENLEKFANFIENKLNEKRMDPEGQSILLLNILGSLLNPRPQGTEKDEKAELMRMWYGTSGVPGEVQIPVTEIANGDQWGVMDLSLGEGESFKALQNSPDPTVPDPLGIKWASILNNLAEGGDTPFEDLLKNNELETATVSNPFVMNPFNTTPTPK